LISEFRLSGPNGNSSVNGDEFIELFNVTSSAIDLSGLTLNATLTGGSALSIRLSGSIPAHGHVLITNSPGYSLGSVYPSGTGSSFATGDITYNGDIALSSTLSLSNGTTVIDSVGNMASLVTSPSSQYSLVRLTATANAPFVLVSTTADTTPNSVQGAPGPQNLSSPIARNDLLRVELFDTNALPNARPNQVRLGASSGANAPQGTLLIRRRITNTGDQNITRLLLRATNLTTKGAMASGQADLRLITSPDDSRISISQNPNASVPISGLTLEAPSTEGTGATQGGGTPGGGGGLNSSIIDEDSKEDSNGVTIDPLAPGESRNINILFRVVTPGNFAFRFDIEVLLAPPTPQQ
jgi:hypothetical protein